MLLSKITGREWHCCSLSYNNNNRQNTTLKLKKKKTWVILHLSWAAIAGMDR